jgi:hypothetical protein
VKRSAPKRIVKLAGHRSRALALATGLEIDALLESSAHKHVATSIDHADRAVATTAVDTADARACATVEGRADSLSFFDKRAHIASRGQIVVEPLQ